MKHIKIMSGRKTVLDKQVDDCSDCPAFETDLYHNCEWCRLLDVEIIRGGMELFDPIPKECPLRDFPSDITSKD